MIDKNLIEKSLALCWREYSDMDIEHYCYFLLSPEFIEKFSKIYHKDFIYTSQDIWFAIYEYQSWQEQPLEDLLSKI